MYQETHFSANVWKALKNDEAFIGENDTSFNKKNFFRTFISNFSSQN